MILNVLNFYTNCLINFLQNRYIWAGGIERQLSELEMVVSNRKIVDGTYIWVPCCILVVMVKNISAT
jgi:hypothetical protein